ncbi:hypothetical protein NQ504_06930 [Ligilactobacillus ruminis]|uniref:Uncharacterized protein n=1 Tax=Ligilactobacillus ruminis ATCC 25644 TaxID=525362 RepID=E7FR41_9LACO|nr:hypothetical protein [Ligilactobacillus ruminis]EFZ34428.1 hypothetical protein HMPREF0542_11368 [Ligilactobacillus ruminis ATCC 25644]EGX97609.1 hypothetical protein ANHS_1822 [Ligilactobacillus ruminis ATCC 25644]UWP39480.1 hypothetical protein NQ504_06930 [Ligilactobacillus ruminis]
MAVFVFGQFVKKTRCQKAGVPKGSLLKLEQRALQRDKKNARRTDKKVLLGFFIRTFVFSERLL